MANERQRAQRMQTEMQRLFSQMKEQDEELAEAQRALGIIEGDVALATRELERQARRTSPPPEQLRVFALRA